MVSSIFDISIRQPQGHIEVSGGGPTAEQLKQGGLKKAGLRTVCQGLFRGGR